MSTRVRTTLVAAAALIGLAVAGCSSSGGTASDTNAPGGSTGASSQPLSRAAYKNLLTRIAGEEQDAQNAAQSALGAGSVSELRKGLLAFAADQSRVSAQLSAVTPPADAAMANAALAKAFDANATATRQLADKLADIPSMTLAKNLIAGAGQASGQAIDAALNQLKKLGYTKGS